MKAKLAALAVLALILGSVSVVPAAMAAPTQTAAASDAGQCVVAPNPDGTLSVTCGPGQSWPNDPSIGQCFDKKLQADGVTVVVTCEPVGVEPPTSVPPTPVPSPTPCGVSVNADGTIAVTCGPGQSWPNDPSIGQCFDKKLQADGVTIVVTCEPVGVEPPTTVPPPPLPTPNPHPCGVATNADGTLTVTCGPGQSWPNDPSIGQCFDKKLLDDGVTVVVLCVQAGGVVAPPPAPTKVVPKATPATSTAAQKLAAKKLAAKKLAAKKAAAKKAAAKKLAAKKLAAKKAAAKKAAAKKAAVKR